MFETFVFGTQAQTASTYDEMSASPTDCSFLQMASPQPSTPHKSRSEGLHEIVQQFSQQSLCFSNDDEEPQQSIWTASSLSSPDFDQMEVPYLMGTTDAQRHQAIQAVSTLPPARSPRGTASCRRLQRQLNVQLQSCATHIKDLHTLVEEMVSTSSQCRLVTSTPIRPSPFPSHNTRPITPLSPIHDPNSSTDEYVFTSHSSFSESVTPDDEGYAEITDIDFLALNEALSLGRASTPSGIRKVHVLKWTKSADCVGALVGGKAKVRNVTRMRRRESPMREPVQV